MRIGIDCRTIFDVKNGEVAGVGHYTYFLIKNLVNLDQKNEYVLFVYNHALDLEDFIHPNVKIVKIPLIKYRKLLPFVYSHMIMPAVYYKEKLDILHFPAPYRALFYFRPTVVTVHDLAPYKNPEWFPHLHPFFTKMLIPASIHRARTVIAVSQNTKNDVHDTFEVEPEKIRVIVEGVEDYSAMPADIDMVRNEIKDLKKFFLFIGTIEPRKNLARLIRAYAQFKNKHPQSEVKLVIAGKLGWKYEDVLELLKDGARKEDVIVPGFINKDEKLYLLRNALALTYPSLYEGFGLPLLEAMIMGIPIVTSNLSSIPEIVLDNAVLVDPESETSISQGLEKVAQDSQLREGLGVKSKRMASQYTWEECAKQTLGVYESIIK